MTPASSRAALTLENGRVPAKWATLSGEGCPGARLMPFLAGTEPQYAAPCTGGGFRWPWQSREAVPAEQAPARPAPAQPAREPEKKKPWWKRWLPQ